MLTVTSQMIIRVEHESQSVDEMFESVLMSPVSET